MPELPEVETIIQGLKDAQPPIKGAVFLKVWTDTPKILKFNPKELVGLRVKDIERRGKNILMSLSEDKTLLIHQKMTGHLLYGDYKEDPYNKHIRVKLFLDNDEVLSLSDLRKFAKIELLDRDSLKKMISRLGPEPLEISLSEFKKLFEGRTGRIKSLLLNQSFLVGLGNIYTDEVLWLSKIHPFRKANTLTEPELDSLYKNIREVLKRAIKNKGTSTSDYRTLDGNEGQYQNLLNVYQKEGQACPRCGKDIDKRKLSSSRTTRFCPNCQRL